MSNLNNEDDLMMSISAFCYHMIRASAMEPGNVFVLGYTHAMKDILSIIEGTEPLPLPPESGLCGD